MDVGKIIGLAIGLLVAAAILPTAIVTISNTTAGGPWDGASSTILTLVPVIGIVVVAVFLVYVYKSMTN